MAVNDHWIYQGRQQHGWFGNGTAPHTDNQHDTSGKGGLFAPADIAARMDYVAHSLIGHLPRSARGHFAATFDDRSLEKLRTVASAWYGASALSRNEFRRRLLDPSTSDEAVDLLRGAARGMVEAGTHKELGTAGEDLAEAVQRIGLDRWPRYLADADRRAVAATSDGAIPGITKISATGDDLSKALIAGLLLGAVFLAYQASRGRQSGARATPPMLAGPPLTPLPPTIVTAVPVPPPKEGETPADVLKPSGQLVGEKGSKPEIRLLPGGLETAEELFERLSKGGTDITPPGHIGQVKEMPNGDVFGIRAKSDSGPPTIDVNVENLEIEKLKFMEKIRGGRK